MSLMIAIVSSVIAAGSPTHCDSFDGAVIDNPVTMSTELFDPEKMPAGEYLCIPHSPGSNKVKRLLKGSLGGYNFIVEPGRAFAVVSGNGAEVKAFEGSNIHWVMSCHYDATEDVRACGGRREDLDFGIVNGKWRLGVGLNHFVPSEVVLRIDRQQPIVVDARNNLDWHDQKIFDAIKVGEMVRLRWRNQAGKTLNSKFETTGAASAEMLARQLDRAYLLR